MDKKNHKLKSKVSEYEQKEKENESEIRRLKETGNRKNEQIARLDHEN